MHKCLGVSDNEVKEVVSKLSKEGLIRVKDTEILGDNELKKYFATEFYGPYILFEKTELNSDTLFEAMNDIKDFVTFGYTKDFKFPIEKLEKLRQQSHDALNPIKEKEKEFFYEALGVPRNFEDSNFPSFVTTRDPTTSEEYGFTRRTNQFTFRGEFNSLEEAFKIGFDNAYGRLIINSAFEEDKRKGFFSPIKIKKDSGIYQLKLENIRYSTMEYSLSFQKEVQKGLETVQNRLEKVLD